MEGKVAEKPNGKLGVLVVGNGAVATTFMTGVLMTRKGLAKPIGSMTQYDKIRVGRGENKKYLHYKDIVPLADLNDIVFGTWDVYPANAYESALNAQVLKEKDIEPVKDELMAIKPMKAAFDKNYAKRLEGDNTMGDITRWQMVENLRKDIQNFKKETGVERVVVLWAASTEVYVPVDEKYHGTEAAMVEAMKADDREHIAPSMCYARGLSLHHGRSQHDRRLPRHVGGVRKNQDAYLRQGFQDRPDTGEVRFRSYHRHTLPRSRRLVLHQYPRQP